MYNIQTILCVILKVLDVQLRISLNAEAVNELCGTAK